MRSRTVGTIGLGMLGVAGLALSASSALAGPIEVIYTKIPGTPKAVVPGAVDINGAPAASDFRALEDFFVSPDGSRWMLKGRTQLGSDLENILISGSGTSGSRLLQEGNLIAGGAADERVEFFGSGIGRFNDLNHFAFSLRARTMATGSTNAANGQRVFSWDGSSITLRFKQGDPITGLQDTTTSGDELFGNSVGSIHPLNNGVIGSQDSTITNISSTRRPAIMYDSAAFKQSNVDTFNALSGGTQMWATIAANAFFTTPDNAHWMAQGRGTGQGTSDTVLVRDNTAVLETGQAIGGSGVVVGTSIPQWSLRSNGTWCARGAVPTGSTDKWAVVNGALVAKTGDPIITGATELWGATFQSFSCNDAGEWVMAGVTNNADPGVNEVLVYNGTQVIAREGDPVDIDGNGMFDDNAFIGRGTNTLSAFEAFDVELTNGRMVYFIANLRDGSGVDLNSSPSFGTPQAFMRVQVDVVPPACPADFNGVGGVTVQDIFDFLAAWFSNSPGADFNGMNGITVQDIFDFLSAWFTGCP